MSDNPQECTNNLDRAEHYIYLAAGYILVFAAVRRMLIITAESAGHGRPAAAGGPVNTVSRQNGTEDYSWGTPRHTDCGRVQACHGAL